VVGEAWAVPTETSLFNASRFCREGLEGLVAMPAQVVEEPYTICKPWTSWRAPCSATQLLGATEDRVPADSDPLTALS